MYYGWSPYVPVAQRRAKALKKMEKLRKKGMKIYPVKIEGRKIAKTFWGNAWCTHLEAFSDYENRLPRGRTYVRNGSVCHLEIQKGLVTALVAGSEIYNITINITSLPKKRWKVIQEKCAGEIGSVLELLKGKLSDNIMNTVTDHEKGLFPLIKDIKLDCDCPDWATMCKHIAAVLYGIGASLDQKPELLFLLRGVDHMDLVQVEKVNIPQSMGKKPQVSGDLSDIFGIDLDEGYVVPKRSSVTKKVTHTSKQKINISRGIRASHIKKLRKEFSMSESEFAKLLGKSINSIRKWEAAKGVLSLQNSSRTVLEKAFKMNKTEAWKRWGNK